MPRVSVDLINRGDSIHKANRARCSAPRIPVGMSLKRQQRGFQPSGTLDKINEIEYCIITERRGVAQLAERRSPKP